MPCKGVAHELEPGAPLHRPARMRVGLHGGRLKAGPEARLHGSSLGFDSPRLHRRCFAVCSKSFGIRQTGLAYLAGPVIPFSVN